MLVLLGLLLVTPPRLANARLRAEFGPRGLVALTDVAQHAVYRLARDEFLITIGGVRYDSRSLPTPQRTAHAALRTVVFRWAASQYRVDVVYELRSEWGFVSKQIFVTGGGGAGVYHVDDVTVFDAALVDTIRNAYVPGSRRASLGTGDYGGALRFAGGRGLLAVVQNPFLEFRRDGNAFAIRYQPDMDWRAGYRPFPSDRRLLAPGRRPGRTHPAPTPPPARRWPPGPARRPGGGRGTGVRR